MAYECEFCGKKVVRAKSGIHKHSGLWRRRAPKTIRLWKPNLRNIKVMFEGKVKKTRVCAKCLKSSKIIGKEI